MAHMDEIENSQMNGSIQTQNGPMNKTLHVIQLQDDCLHELLGRLNELIVVSQESFFRFKKLYPLLDEISELSRNGHMNIGSSEKEELRHAMDYFGDTLREYVYLWEELYRMLRELVK